MSMNEKVDVEVAGLRLQVEVEGLLPMEIMSIAGSVNDRLDQVRRLYPSVVDTRKLSVYAAFYMGIDLYREKQARETNQKAVENTLESVARTLQDTLRETGVSPEPGPERG